MYNKKQKAKDNSPKELKMKAENMNYEKVAEIDREVIFADKDGYFLFEHCPTKNGWYSIRIRLGKTANEVELSLEDYGNWSYRAWNGEMQDILKAQEEVRRLPDIQ